MKDFLRLQFVNFIVAPLFNLAQKYESNRLMAFTWGLIEFVDPTEAATVERQVEWQEKINKPLKHKR